MDDGRDAYEDSLEIMLSREYQDLSRIFRYVVVTAERTYLCNDVLVDPTAAGQQLYFRVRMVDAWVWDGYLASRFLDGVEVYSLADVHVEELKRDLEM